VRYKEFSELRVVEIPVGIEGCVKIIGVTLCVCELKSRVFIFILILNEHEYEKATAVFVRNLSENVTI
jgi:hypothetical protein